MNKTAIVILNWNGLQHLHDFLPILIENTPVDLAEIIVADNSSSDESLVWLKETWPQIRIIEFDKNLGFAGGYNKAIEQIQHELIVILNSDIKVSPDWLAPLLKHFDDPQVGAVMPKILSYANPEQFEYAGASGGFIDKFGYPFCRGRMFNHIETDLQQYNEVRPVFWTTGACMVIRRASFMDAGGFDSDFFAHMEEIDLCWRMQNRGQKLLVEPDSAVYHVGGGTLPNENPYKIYLNFRNNLYVLLKNLPSGMLVRILFIRFVLDGIAALQFLATGKPRFSLAVLKAHSTFYSNFRKTLNKRQGKQIQNPQSLDGFYSRSIVVDNFIRKKRAFSELGL